MNITLSPLQAFNAMTKLLDEYYSKTKSGDIGVLLGGMSFLEDDCTVDAGAWSVWIRSIQNKPFVTKQEAFEGMIKYLENYQKNTSSQDVKDLIDAMVYSYKISLSMSYKKMWELFVDIALHESERARYYLKLTK